MHGTYDAPWESAHHSGAATSVGAALRTHVHDQFESAPLRTVTVLAEPVGSRRLDNISLLDVRVEKRVRLRGSHRMSAFLDVFNGLNANPEQNPIWSSGSSYLRPLSIVSPRVAKVGLSFDW